MSNYEEMVVIFLDVLGSKEIQGFNEKFKIHQIFHQELKENENRQNTQAKKNVIYTRKIFSFSDCAFIFYKYKSDIDKSRKNINNLLITALFNTSLTILKITNEGYLIRGGVTYGEAYFDDLSFFGPAVERAYLIESKKALFPRVLIDSNFGKKLFNYNKKIKENNFGKKSKYYRFLPKRTYIPSEIIQDKNEFILNFLYILEQEGHLDFYGKNLKYNDVISVIKQTISRNKEKHQNNDKIIQKLEWMNNYIQASKLSLENEIDNVTFMI